MFPEVGVGKLVPPLTTRGLTAAGEEIGSSEAGKPFGEVLRSALGEVNKLQLAADRQNELLAAGVAKDLHSVVIASEKASVALQLTLQIRNKALEAYQEIMRMQV